MTNHWNAGGLGGPNRQWIMERGLDSGRGADKHTVGIWVVTGGRVS